MGLTSSLKDYRLFPIDFAYSRTDFHHLATGIVFADSLIKYGNKITKIYSRLLIWIFM